jgi:hypothetical protein
MKGFIYYLLISETDKTGLMVLSSFALTESIWKAKNQEQVLVDGNLISPAKRN